MKKIFIITGLLWVAIISFAQSSGIKVLVNDKTIGKILATQEEIRAKEYIFPERIYQSYIDTISKSITLQLRGLSNNGKWMNNRGKIVLYDLVGEKVKWSKQIAFQKSRIYQSGNTIIYTAAGLGNRCFSLNIENGKNLWKSEHIIFFVDPVSQIGIGYKYGVSDDNLLEGINLKNGKVIWQRELNKKYGWDDVFPLNDSIWMIVAAGLHTVDFRNGLGWSYITATTENDYKAATVTNVAGLALGLLTGTFIIATEPDLIKGIESNVYSDSTGFYFASKEKISRIRKDEGTAKWWCLLPEKTASNSSIFVKADTVYMINHGYAFMHNRQINFGKPFFAAYNKEYGEQLFFHTIDMKKNPILDFEVENDHLLLLFKDRLEKRSLFDGTLILEKTINNNELGELRHFVGNQVYIDSTSSSLKSLVFSDISKNYVFTSNDKILIFDGDLKNVGDIDINQLYIARMRKNDFLIVTKDNQTFILDTDNKKVAEIDLVLKPVLIGNKLYSIHDKSFFEIDLTNLIKTREIDNLE